MKSKIIATTFLGVGLLIGASALSAVAAWTAPTDTPPTCNSGSPGCDAPINVSTAEQKKFGPLVVNFNSIGDIGLTVLGKIKIIDAGAVAGTNLGKVLTSDANGVGTWQTPVAGGGSASTTPVAGLKFFRGEGQSHTLDLQGATKVEIDAWGPSNYLAGGEAGDHVKSFKTVTSSTCTIVTGNFESSTRYTRVTCGNVVVNALGYGASGTNQGDVVILNEKCPVNLCYRAGEGSAYWDTGGALIKYQN